MLNPDLCRATLTTPPNSPSEWALENFEPNEYPSITTAIGLALTAKFTMRSDISTSRSMPRVLGFMENVSPFMLTPVEVNDKSRPIILG